MILYRKKWRWDAAAMRPVLNWYWKIFPDHKSDDDFPTLVAFDANMALALANIEGADISSIKDVDNLGELKKRVREDYERELASETKKH